MGRRRSIEGEAKNGIFLISLSSALALGSQSYAEVSADCLTAAGAGSQGLSDPSPDFAHMSSAELRSLRAEQRSHLEAFADTNDLTDTVIAAIDAASITSAFPRLREHSRTAGREPGAGKWYGTSQWQALTVLARHGDGDAAARVVELIEREPDQVWRATRGVEIVTSIRQPEIIHFLEQMLNSDEKLPEIDGGWQEPVYLRALGALAGLLKGFPTQEPNEDQLSYVVRCRAWVKAHSSSWEFRSLE